MHVGASDATAHKCVTRSQRSVTGRCVETLREHEVRTEAYHGTQLRESLCLRGDGAPKKLHRDVVAV
eukprot:2566447-Pleurochrysis_carterae.AAC.2